MKPYRRHGFSHTRIDNIYKGIVDRCGNPNSRNYYKYGAKGIRVCDEWEADKTKFFEWAFNNGYSDELTLDRIDNSKGYDPNNCRWATYKEQNNNRTSNRMLTAFGETKTMAQWAEEKGISERTLHARLKRGWSVEMALTEEVSFRRRVFKVG